MLACAAGASSNTSRRARQAHTCFIFETLTSDSLAASLSHSHIYSQLDL